jgi:hypothetical protein
MDSAALCFSCGLPVSTPPRLNDMPDGTPCRTCRARALDLVAAALPNPAGLQLLERDEEDESDSRATDYRFDTRSLDDYPEPA